MDERSFPADCAQSFAEWILDCRAGIRAPIREQPSTTSLLPHLHSFLFTYSFFLPIVHFILFILSFVLTFCLLLSRFLLFSWLVRLSAYFDKLKSKSGVKWIRGTKKAIWDILSYLSWVISIGMRVLLKRIIFLKF